MKRIYLILPVISGILFGSSGTFVRTLTQNGIDATTLLFLRFSLAIFLLLIAILLTDKKLLKIKINDFKLFLVTALSIIGLNLCYNTSMNSIPLSLAAVLLSSAPVFVIVFAYILFGEEITSKKIISIIFVIIGCILTTGLLEGNVLNVSAIGILGGIGAAIFWALYTVTSKKSLENRIHTYTILFYSLVLISIILLPLTDFNQITSYVNSNVAFNIIFLILHSSFCFALPYILLTVSLNYIDSGSVSILTSGSEPLAALSFGMIFYGEFPTVLTFLGIILTIIALVNLTKSES